MKGLMVPLLFVFMTGTVVGQQRVIDGTSSDEIASVLNRQSNNFSPLSDRQAESGRSGFAPISVPERATGPTPDDSFRGMTDSDSSTTVRQSATGDPQPDMFYVATERGDLSTLLEKADVSLGVDIVPVDRSTGQKMPLSYATGVVLELDINNGKRIPYESISPVRLYTNGEGDNVIRFELSDDQINLLLSRRLQYSFTEGQRGQVDRVEFASASAIERARRLAQGGNDSSSIVSRNESPNSMVDSRTSIPATGLALPGDFDFVGPVRPSNPFSRQRSNASDFSNPGDSANRTVIDLPAKRETNSFSGGFSPPGQNANALPPLGNENSLGQTQRPLTNAEWQVEVERRRLAQEKEAMEQQRIKLQRDQEQFAWQQQQQRLRQPNVVPERYTDNSTQFGGTGQSLAPVAPLQAPPLKRTQDDIGTLADNDRILNQKLDRLFDVVNNTGVRQVSMQTKINPSAMPIAGGGMQPTNPVPTPFDPRNSVRPGEVNPQGERVALLDQQRQDVGVAGSVANQNQKRDTEKRVNEVDPKKTGVTDRGAGQATFMLLLGSLGLNAYLGLLCRSIYVRYNEIGDELRETFTSGLSRD